MMTYLILFFLGKELCCPMNGELCSHFSSTRVMADGVFSFSVTEGFPPFSNTFPNH